MNTQILEFAKITFIEKDIAEVIINEGVELTSALVDEFHTCLIENLHSPFSLLINKVNSYTYDFQAQLKLGNIQQIHVMAVVIYTRIAEVSTDLLANTVPREKPWNMQIFYERSLALEWLREQQEKVAK